MECLSTIESDCDSWCRTVFVDNLENFNERPDKRNEELEVCGQVKTNTLECQ